MKLTAHIRLLPSAAQADALRQTLAVANAACNELSEYAFKHQVFGQFGIHKATYYSVKEAYQLSAQLVVRCISKVADAYKLDKETKRVFRPTGGIAYDSRILTYKQVEKTASIWTLGGRQKIPYTIGPHHARLMVYQKGESDLVLVNRGVGPGKFYLLATCELPDESVDEFDDVLGADLGLVNLATDSDGRVFSGAGVETVRQWYAGRRAKLQSVGTRSAKRRLKQLSGRQRRFQKDTNHLISKRLVTKAKGTRRAIALEDLKGIRKRATVRKGQRARHSNWAFNQLRLFIQYKAQLSGVTVLLIDPRHTSRTCNGCGHCEKANRRSQSEFVCRRCGHSVNADLNATQNIRALGLRQLAYGGNPLGLAASLPL